MFVYQRGPNIYNKDAKDGKTLTVSTLIPDLINSIEVTSSSREFDSSSKRLDFSAVRNNLLQSFLQNYTSHSAYVSTETELPGAEIDGSF